MTQQARRATGPGVPGCRIVPVPDDVVLTSEMWEFARRSGASEFPVLLSGATGVGKTQLARVIHRLGPRGARPFVRVNCGAIPDSLFEREMFGHVRGAFTDAREAGEGYLEAADGGVLFLDEIAELPLHVQPKLLAVLEDGKFRRLGSPREVRADVRVIAATNADLRARVGQKLFREDLFHRLAVLRYTLPSLCGRVDLEAMVRHVLARVVPGPLLVLAPDALACLCAYRWPGNIRELENALQHAALAAGDGCIDARCLPDEVRAPGPEHAAPDSRARRYVAPVDPADEERTIATALAAAGGNRTHAARALGMSRAALWIKMQRHGVVHAPPGGEGRRAG